MIIDNLPFDKYELEPSPLTLYILARKQPKVCWQVYIQVRLKKIPRLAPFSYIKFVCREAPRAAMPAIRSGTSKRVRTS